MARCLSTHFLSDTESPRHLWPASAQILNGTILAPSLASFLDPNPFSAAKGGGPLPLPHEPPEKNFH